MKNIVVFTGAGISAESGIDVFRGSDGLWCNHKVEDVCTYDAWIRNRKLVNDFYNQRRKQLFEVEPNKGHTELVKLEQKYNVYIITQNVDDLHERAGSSNITHLHGELLKARSLDDDTNIIELDKPEIPYEDTKKWRPHIVWFGEAVPMFEKAITITNKADILIIIGTSLNVYPAASLVNYADPNIPKYLVDPNAYNAADYQIGNLTVFKDKATVGVPKVVDILMK